MISTVGSPLSRPLDIPFVAEMMMMVREETRSHFYFYYSYHTRRRGSRECRSPGGRSSTGRN